MVLSQVKSGAIRSMTERFSTNTVSNSSSGSLIMCMLVR